MARKRKRPGFQYLEGAIRGELGRNLLAGHHPFNTSKVRLEGAALGEILRAYAGFQYLEGAIRGCDTPKKNADV